MVEVQGWIKDKVCLGIVLFFVFQGQVEMFVVLGFEYKFIFQEVYSYYDYDYYDYSYVDMVGSNVCVEGVLDCQVFEQLLFSFVSNYQVV